MATSPKGVSDSRFYMWRAIFALAHADSVITHEERSFMNDALNKVAFSDDQRRLLENDMEFAQNVADMFARVIDAEDRNKFFYFARMLVWSDGDFGAQEQKIMLALQKAQLKNIDVERAVKMVDLQLDDSEKYRLKQAHKEALPERGGFLDTFLRRFNLRS